MAEKDNGKYHYEPYTQLPKPPGGPLMGGPSIRREFQGASKMSPSEHTVRTVDSCCACNSTQNGPFWVGLLTNLGICALLFAYTLLGKLSKTLCALYNIQLSLALVSRTHIFHKSHTLSEEIHVESA